MYDLFALKKNNVITLLLLVLCFAYFSFYILTMEWVSGGADSYSHYLISHYAFKHPELFLHHWGKPFFTLVSSPFAQFGLKGLEIFNLLVMLLAGLSASKLANRLGYSCSWTAIVMTMFAPIVFINVFSGITEPLGALLTVFGVLMFSNRKYVSGVLSFSFLLFVRNESVIFIPLVLLYLGWIKQIKYAILLAVAPILYSVVGAFHYGSVLWIIQQFPYTGAKEIYNSGELFGFLDSYQSITHLALGLSLVVGILSMVLGWIKSKKQDWESDNYKLELLILLIVIAYFSAHSFVWWLGIGGSLGLKRVLVLIIPLMAVIGLRGLESISLFLFRALQYHKLKPFFYILFSVLVIFISVDRFKLPKALDKQNLVLKELIKDHRFMDHGTKLGYFHPIIPYFANVDPFEKNNVDLIANGKGALNSFETGDMVIWDSHFGVNEGHTSISDLEGNFSVVDSSGIGNFDVIVFRKK